MTRWNKKRHPQHLRRAPCTRHLCWCWPRTPRREWCLTTLEVSSPHVRCIFCLDFVFWLHYCSRWQPTNVVSDLLLTYCLFRQKRRLHRLWHVWAGQVQEPVGALLQRLPGTCSSSPSSPLTCPPCRASSSWWTPATGWGWWWPRTSWTCCCRCCNTRLISEAEGLVSVFAGNCRKRLFCTKWGCNFFLQHPDIQARRLPILFFANKMDSRWFEEIQNILAEGKWSKQI